MSTDALVKKDQDIDSDDEEELEIQRKGDSDAPKAAEVEEDTSLANSDVTTKYQEAAKITQAALLEVAAMVRTFFDTNYVLYGKYICDH